MDSFEFDPAKAAQVADNDVLPADEYLAMIADVEDKETKDRNGKYLKLELQITVAKNPQYQGWKVYDMINYRNQNPKAEEIGWRTLKSISRAIFGDENQRFSTQHLIGKKIKIKTFVQDDGQYQNSRVRKYSSFTEGLGNDTGGGAMPGAFQPQQAQQAQQRQQPSAGQVQPAAQGYQQQQQQRPAQQQQRYQQQPQQPQQQQNFNDDDVPF
jgi:hypothetical protein